MKTITFRHIFTLSLIASTLGLVMPACGPAETTKPPPGPKYTLENVCSKIAAPTCAMRQSCCTQSSGYDEAGCIAAATAECEANVADVNAGIMTFDGEFIDACIAATQPYSDKCFLNINDLYGIPEDLEPCTHVFAGQLAEGAACERSEQCKSSVADREFTRCDSSTKKCKTYSFLQKDAACQIDPNTTKICDEGLYCKAFLLSGKCAPNTAFGAPCTPKQPVTLECGLGFACDSTTLTCVDAKPNGEACSILVDCKSLTCTNSVCTQPDPLFTKMQCTNMP